MIEIDGTQIDRVVSIECNDSTGFKTEIDFLFDSKLADCQDLLPLMRYDLVHVAKETHDDLGVMRVVLSKQIDISFST